MDKKGQSVILFCLILSAVILTLLSSIMLSLNSYNKSVNKLKSRILGYQATVQISQIIQQGYETYKKYPTCTGLGVPTTIVPVGTQYLCLPSAEICIENQFRYCVAKNPNYMISENFEYKDDESQVKAEPNFRFDFSFLPKAYAQTSPRPWLPNLSGAPTADISQAGMAANMLVSCEPAAGFNSYCYKIRICTNGSSTCTNADDYYTTVVAIVFQR